ncbi:MAG: NAD(P)/FAD-dependent oxidoreductase [Burkholderiales bacterium]|nr:NAD(P)/FAD-dependent oxidoreductase [Burkholderiales bacterium]
MEFDVAIIGSGPGGYRAAVLAALRGLKPAIVEAGAWGGTCLNRGCVPKKAWYHTARLLALGDRLAARGARGTLEPDLDAAWRDQRRVVETVRTSYVDYLKRLGVAVIGGRARLQEPGEIAVAGHGTITAKHVVVASGSAPHVPDALPLRGGRVITTDALFDAPPPDGRRVAVVGSGVIGTEMAFILAMLGREVVWLTRAQPLSNGRFSAPALAALRAALADHGIVARTASRPAACSVAPQGVTLRLPDGSDERVDWVLVAAGRRPRTAGLGLERAGVALDERGFVRVDERQRTTAPGVYAIGDCTNRAMTSNHALAEATVAIADIVAPGSARSQPERVPTVVYSALELARLGLNEDEAEAAGHEVATGFAGLEASPAALASGDARGFVRLVADADSGALLGAEGVGSHAGEWIHAIGACADRADALAALAAIRYNHPSMAEEIQNAAETLAARWGLSARVFPGHVE